MSAKWGTGEGRVERGGREHHLCLPGAVVGPCTSFLTRDPDDSFMTFFMIRINFYIFWMVSRGQSPTPASAPTKCIFILTKIPSKKKDKWEKWKMVVLSKGKQGRGNRTPSWINQKWFIHFLRDFYPFGEWQMLQDSMLNRFQQILQLKNMLKAKTFVRNFKYYQ